MKPETLSLEAVSDEPLLFSFELPFSIEALDREPLLAISPVRFAGKVARVEGGYVLEGGLAYHGRLECSRCLEPYPFEQQEEFTLLLCPRRPAAEGEVTLEKEDLDACFYDEPAIAVAPIVEERVQMAVPMKPLCRADCRGLCPHCGQDLNSGECGCAVEVVDPRWEALKKLKQKV